MTDIRSYEDNRDAGFGDYVQLLKRAKQGYV